MHRSYKNKRPQAFRLGMGACKPRTKKKQLVLPTLRKMHKTSEATPIQPVQALNSPFAHCSLPFVVCCTMSERVVKPILISLKRDFKVLECKEKEVDAALSTSHLDNIDGVMRAPRSHNSSSSESASESGDESIPEGPADSGQVEDVTTEEAAGTVAPEEAGAGSPCPQEHARVDSPQPGPSNHYEDISFEPVRTSTPVEDCDKDMSCGEVNFKDIKKEMRDGKMLMSQIEFEFIKDIRDSIKQKSKIHIAKLNKRRNKISKKVAHLKKQRRHIDNMLSLLNNEKDEIDDAVHKLTYVAENFPC